MLFNVSDNMSLSVNPPGMLDIGSQIVVRCMIRFSGPNAISSDQDPTLAMTLDNEANFPKGQLYVESPAGTVSFHRKTLVIFFACSETCGIELKAILHVPLEMK